MDTVKRGGIFLFSAAILAYLGFLLQQNTVITQPTMGSERNMISYAIIALVFLYLMIFYAIKPTYIKRAKLINATLGIVLLLLGHNVLTNNIETQLYVGDIVTVLGVILTILSLTNVLILKKVKQQKEESEVEIIEV